MNSKPRYSSSLHLLSFWPRLKTRPAELTANTVSPGIRVIRNNVVLLILSLSMSIVRYHSNVFYLQTKYITEDIVALVAANNSKLSFVNNVMCGSVLTKCENLRIG